MLLKTKVSLITLFVFLLLQQTIFAQEDCLFLAVESAEVAEGDQVCLDVSIANTPELEYIDWKITWEDTVLTYTGITNVLLSDFNYNENFSDDGWIPMSWFTLPPNIYSTDIPERLFTICFDAIGSNGDFSTLELIEIEVGNVANPNAPYCYAPAQITLSNLPDTTEQMLILGSTVDLDCQAGEMGSIQVVPFFAIPPFAYDWTGPPIAVNNGSEISGLAPGVYRLTVTDNDGLTGTADFSLHGTTGTLTAALVIGSPCANIGTGTIDIEIDGLVPPLAFQWSNGASSEDLTDLPAGTYTVVVTDVNNCMVTGSFEVTNQFQHLSSIEVVGTNQCPGDANIEINLNPNQSAPEPFSYNWSNGSTSEDISNLAAGTYSVTITDADGCIGFYDVEVPGDTSIYSNSLTTWCSSFDMDDGAARIVVNPQMSGYTYHWNDGLTNPGNQARQDMAPGNYSLTVTNPSGCEVLEIDSVIIQEGLSGLREDYYSCDLDTLDIFTFYDADTLFHRWYPESNFVDPFSSEGLYLIPDYDPNDSIPDYFLAHLNVTATGGCKQSYSFNVFVQEDCVWPGDTNADEGVDATDILNIALGNGATGPARDPLDIEWFAQPTTPWGMNIPGSTLDMTYADADGNGTVNAEDTLMVTYNYGLSHRSFTSDQAESRGGGIPLSIALDDPIRPEQNYSFDIVLGSNSDPVVDAYGLAFTIQYDPELIHPNFTKINEEGWLSNNDEVWDLDFINEAVGRIDVVMTRVDGTSISGQGKIGKLQLQFNPFEDNRAVEITIGEAYLINQLGMPIAVTGMTSNSTLVGTITSVNNLMASENEFLFPNPAKNQLEISTDRELEYVVLYNAVGQRLGVEYLKTKRMEIKHLQTGVYYLALYGPDGVSRLSFVKI